jgi:hypothetical protein
MAIPIEHRRVLILISIAMLVSAYLAFQHNFRIGAGYAIMGAVTFLAHIIWGNLMKDVEMGKLRGKIVLLLFLLSFVTMFVMWNYDFHIGAQSTLAIIISISIYAFWRILQEGIADTERDKLIGIR